MPTNVAALTREHAKSFVNDQLIRWKPTTAAVRCASLKVFFGWLVDEGEIKDSPMARMQKPLLPAGASCQRGHPRVRGSLPPNTLRARGLPAETGTARRGETGRRLDRAVRH
jgi:hypothetical protein